MSETPNAKYTARSGNTSFSADVDHDDEDLDIYEALIDPSGAGGSGGKGGPKGSPMMMPPGMMGGAGAGGAGAGAGAGGLGAGMASKMGASGMGGGSVGPGSAGAGLGGLHGGAGSGAGLGGGAGMGGTRAAGMDGVDTDGDGIPDDFDGDGIPDMKSGGSGSGYGNDGLGGTNLPGGGNDLGKDLNDQMGDDRFKQPDVGDVPGNDPNKGGLGDTDLPDQKNPGQGNTPIPETPNPGDGGTPDAGDIPSGGTPDPGGIPDGGAGGIPDGAGGGGIPGGGGGIPGGGGGIPGGGGGGLPGGAGGEPDLKVSMEALKADAKRWEDFAASFGRIGDTLKEVALSEEDFGHAKPMQAGYQKVQTKVDGWVTDGVKTFTDVADRLHQTASKYGEQEEENVDKARGTGDAPPPAAPGTRRDPHAPQAV